MGFPCGSAGKESACNVGDLGSIPGLARAPGEGKDYPLQYSGLGNPMDCIDHGVAKSQTRLSDFHFQSSCMPLVTVFSTDQHITLFHLCFRLKTPYLMHTVNSLTLNSQPTAPALIPEGSASIPCVPRRQNIAFLCLESCIAL